MEHTLNFLGSLIKGILLIVAVGQGGFHSFLVSVVENYSSFSAYVLEFSMIALPIMARIIYVRRKQRLAPKPAPDYLISMAPEPVGPDRTIQKEGFRALVIFVAVMLIAAVIL